MGLRKEPRVNSAELSSYLQGIPRDRIMLAQHGGANHNGVQVMAIAAVQGAMTPEEVKAQHELGKAHMEDTQPCGVSEYMSRVCVLIRGSVAGAPPMAATRRQLVKYVANKLGGAHHDTSRSPQNQAERVYIALDALVENDARVADLEAVYFELLSIGQAIAHSDDAKQFIERARQELGTMP